MRVALHQLQALGPSLAAWLDAERERWFFWIPVAFGGGIAVYFSLPVEPGVWVAVVPLVAAAGFGLASRRGGLASAFIATLVAAALGFALAKLRTEAVRAPVLTREIGPVEISGHVERVEPRAARGLRVTLRVATIAGLGDDQRPRRVRFRMATKFGALKTGDAIRLKAVLAPPQPPALPGGYDFARAAWFESLGGVGYAVTRPAIDTSAPPVPWRLGIAAAIEDVRHVIGNRVVAALPGQSGAIARALVTGERGGIEQATNDAYKASGLYHVLSISGLHMVIMAGSVFFFTRLAMATVPSLALRFPIKKWAAAAAVIGAGGYLLISGSAFATVRSVIMIAIMFLAIILDRPAIALRNVALAALVILALWPESLLDAGFQMSFAAVVCLVVAYEEIRRRRRSREGARVNPLLRVPMFFGGVVLSTLVASLAVAPLTAYHFHETQQYALLANVAAIPICNVIVMPAALLTLIAMPFGLEGLPLWIMGEGIDAMTWSARSVASLPGVSTRIAAMSPWTFAFIMWGGLWLALWATPLRFAGLGIIAAGLALVPWAARPDVLVGRDGHLVAARGADGLLAALSAPRSAFELGRWLEHDGDGRAPAQAATGEVFSCDGIGCTVEVKGLRVAVVKHPASLAEDCARAGIVIVRAPKPRGCVRPLVVVDIFAVKALGAHAIYIEGGRAQIETVRTAHQSRPWAEPPAWARRQAAGSARR